MSEDEIAKLAFLIDGQRIDVEVYGSNDLREVGYSISSVKPLAPPQIAFVLLRIAEGIAIDNGIELGELVSTPQAEVNKNVH